MQNLDPYKVSPKAMQEWISFHEFMNSAGLSEPLVELLRLHVSQLNGCINGIRRHSRRVRSLGETAPRMAALADWQKTTLFSERERAALEWSEAVTVSSRSSARFGALSAMRQWFTDVEVVQVTVIIAATSAWNHVEMSLS